MAWRHICDQCRAPQDTFHADETEAREAAKAQGWTQVPTRNGKTVDMCPTCSAQRAAGVPFRRGLARVQCDCGAWLPPQLVACRPMVSGLIRRP